MNASLFNPCLRAVVIATTLAFSLPAAHAANCISCGVSEASQALSSASAVVVTGSVETLAASGKLSVKSVQAMGDVTVIVLKGASDAATGSARLSTKALKGVSMAAGTAIEVSAVSTGYLLIASGKVIAFIPNEIGKALLHQSRVE